jgi:hypothetical protein
MKRLAQCDCEVRSLHAFVQLLVPRALRKSNCHARAPAADLSVTDAAELN